MDRIRFPWTDGLRNVLIAIVVGVGDEAMRVVALATLVVLGLIGTASASNDDSAKKAADCRGTKDNAARLKCYDGAFAEKEAADEEKKAASPPAPAKVVDAMDLAIAPNKYLEKTVEVRGLQCFFADKDSYRCIANPSGPILIVESADIASPDEKKRMEDACDTAKNIPTLACRRTLRFKLEGADHDTVNMLDRTTVTTSTAEVVPEQARKAAVRYRRR